VNVLVLAPLSGEEIASLRAVDPRLEVEHAWDLFAPELVADWPRHTVEWYLPPRFRDMRDTPEMQGWRDARLAVADVVCITFPFPTRIVARAPRLRFVHQLPAGVSNLVRGDLWHTALPVTSGRGAGNTLAIAEWAIAAAVALCKDFPRALLQRASGRLDRAPFRGRQLAGKTLGVVGVGGIGAEVARLGAALGMHVVGTRRSIDSVEHVERLFLPAQLEELLAVSDFVVLCTQLTGETHHLMNRQTLAAMRPGAFLINVARGELIDETALIPLLRSGRLAGFAADVYEGEFEHQPPAELLALDNVILTPHTSGQTEHPSRGALEVFHQNLRRCLAGAPLLNLVNWQRGY
jgi:phosphoglycerate dehydrogenase-like enzyme